MLFVVTRFYHTTIDIQSNVGCAFEVGTKLTHAQSYKFCQISYTVHVFTVIS